MNPSCLVSAVPAGGGVMGVVFSCIDASFVRHSVPKYCWWTAVSLHGQSLLIFFQVETRGEEVNALISQDLCSWWFQEQDSDISSFMWLPTLDDVNVHITNKRPQSAGTYATAEFLRLKIPVTILFGD